MVANSIGKLCRRAAIFGIALSVIATGASAQSATSAASGQPEAIIAGFNASLLNTMKNAGALGFRGRWQALAPPLTEVFHLPVMARIAVGTRWRKLNPDQQNRLVDSFSRLTIATYANRFDGWSGEKFEMRGMQNVRDKTVLVKTAIIRPNDEPVEINYLMRRFEAGWRVIDVFLKQSYSELATKRSEYSSVLRREGFDALIRQIEQKITQYAAGAG
ncbi:MAG: ABC transporter substrate-binding protein [Alphaproteobacteria bacterium]